MPQPQHLLVTHTQQDHPPAQEVTLRDLLVTAQQGLHPLPDMVQLVQLDRLVQLVTLVVHTESHPEPLMEEAKELPVTVETTLLPLLQEVVTVVLCMVEAKVVPMEAMAHLQDNLQETLPVMVMVIEALMRITKSQ